MWEGLSAVLNLPNCTMDLSICNNKKNPCKTLNYSIMIISQQIRTQGTPSLP